MKVIFLDIDGVLNVYGQGHDQYGQTFHKHFEDNLRYIIDETQAKIVISSTWRYSGVANLKNMWIDRDLPGEIIGITSDLNLYQESGENYKSIERGYEIQEWLDEHQAEVTHYVILDDDNDMLQSQRGNFVRTANNINHSDCVDVGYGLTKICAEKAIRILNKQ